MPSTSSDYVYRPVQHDPSMPYTRPAVSPAALTRVQVLTPLSILISAGTLIITSTLIKPRLGEVSSKHPTYITPSATWLMAYWATLYILQIGFALLCVVGQKTETKKLIANGVGIRLALVNFLMAAWAVTWVVATRISFIIGLVLLGLITVLLFLTAAIISFAYPADKRHPLDWIFIHVPIKMFLVSMLQVDLWQQLFLALEWDLSHGPKALEKSLWPSFYLITGVGAFSALWIFTFADLTWAASGVVLNLALLVHPRLSSHGKSRAPIITAAIILSISLQGAMLLGSYLQKYIQSQQAQRQGQIAIGHDEEEEASARRFEAEQEAEAAEARAQQARDEEEAGVEVSRTLGSSQ